MLGNSNQQPEHGHLTLERRLNSSFHCTIIWACSGVRKREFNTSKDYGYTLLYIVHIHEELPTRCREKTKPTSNTHSDQREILTGMLLSSCTSALGRPFLFPSAGSSHTGPGERERKPFLSLNRLLPVLHIDRIERFNCKGVTLQSRRLDTFIPGMFLI